MAGMVIGSPLSFIGEGEIGATDAPPAPIVSEGGLHHIMPGIGSSGGGIVPQTLCTIEVGIAA